MRIIDHFLWKTGSEYAISNHYTRHCVWEEVLQNKRLNKYNHTAIDEQFNLYKADGLTKFDPSDPNTPLPSCASLFLLLSYNFFISLSLSLSPPSPSPPIFLFHGFDVGFVIDPQLVANVLIVVAYFRCSRRLLYCQGTYSNVKFIFVPLVQ